MYNLIHNILMRNSEIVKVFIWFLHTLPILINSLFFLLNFELRFSRTCVCVCVWWVFFYFYLAYTIIVVNAKYRNVWWMPTDIVFTPGRGTGFSFTFPFIQPEVRFPRSQIRLSHHVYRVYSSGIHCVVIVFVFLH